MKQLSLLILFTVLSFSLFSQQYKGELVEVQGKSSVKIKPEIINFNIDITVRDTNYSRCTDLAFEQMQAIKTRFKDLGIDEKLIKTMNYSIREEREYNRQLNKQVFIGYRADIPVMIKTQTDNPLNDKIFEFIKNNFNADFRVNFELSPEQIEKVKKELILLAVGDAEVKAKLLAESTEIKLGKISNIQYGEPQLIRNFSQTNYDLNRSVQMESASAKVGISALTPPNIEMRTHVMLAWKIEY